MRQEAPSPCSNSPPPVLSVANKTELMLKDDKAFAQLIGASSPSLPDDDSSEGGSANGLPALTSPEALAAGANPQDGGASYREVAENGLSAPLDFSTTSSSSSSEDQQPVNLSDRLLPAGSSPPNSYAAEPNKKFPIKTEVRRKPSFSLRDLILRW